MATTLAEQNARDFLALRESINRDSGVDFYNLSHPALWELREGEWVEHFHSFADVYQLIRRYALDSSVMTENLPDAVVLVTCGWAARLPENHDRWNDDDIPRPSEQPDRIRVALVYCVARNGTVYSVVSMEDKPEEDSGEPFGRGALLDACDYLGVGVWKREYTQGVLAWYGDLVQACQAAGEEIESDVVRWFAERLSNFITILGHDTDAPESVLP